MGGSWFEELFGQPEGTDENKLAEIGLSALREQLGILQDPSYCKVIIQKVSWDGLFSFNFYFLKGEGRLGIGDLGRTTIS